MTGRSRVISAFRHIETDKSPCDLSVTSLQYQKLAKTLGNDFGEKWDVSDFCGCVYWGWFEETPEGSQIFRDNFGICWDRSGADKDIGVIKNYVIPDIENNAYVFPDVNEKRLRAELENCLNWRRDKFTYAGIGFSVFERAWSLCGMENIFVAMALSPAALTKLLNDIYEYNAKIMDIMLSYDFDGFYFGDDWGSQRGLMMGIENWRRFIKPVLKKLYAKAKAKGRYIIQHSCGQIEEAFNDLIEIGLDCYQSFQPEIYDIKKVKKEYGGKLSFWGGISTQQLLAKASPQEIKKVMLETLSVMRKGGGYVFAPTHTVEHDVSVENMLAMVETMKNQK